MKIIVTGSAGFIGAAVTFKLLKDEHQVIGIDNLNSYYDINLKKNRVLKCSNFSNYRFIEEDLVNPNILDKLFISKKPDAVIHLAAQAGVRHSISNPMAFIDSNIISFVNLLEAARKINLKHLVFASSSSVYGATSTLPYSETQPANHPISLYAATKKSNEMLAHSYSHLFGLPMTGLRFFTVYGPWGRPDMALFSFSNSILKGMPVELFNHGRHKRDFTYIDDIVEGVVRVLKNPPNLDKNWNCSNPDSASSSAPWRIYNLGSGRLVTLIEYVKTLEKHLNKKAVITMLPLQMGDMQETYADITAFEKSFSFRANTSIDDGVRKFVDWYRNYYKI